MSSDIYCCDNLEMMSCIDSNSVDLIYCDILYGTGRDFGDYKDLKPIRKDIEEHYTPRIKEMYRILKDTGSIYLQMDQRINHWIRCIMDDLKFNFLNQIYWRRTNSVSGGKASCKFIPNNVDIILCCGKSSVFTFNKQFNNYLPETLKLFNQEDERGKFRWQSLSTYSQETYDRLAKEKKIKVPQTSKHPQQKQYIDEKEGSLIDNCWIDIKRLSKIDYYSQKSEELISRLIKIGSNEGDVVADFYMGSGTTAVVCKELNRNFIGCDINPKAIEITKQRLNGILQ